MPLEKVFVEEVLTKEQAEFQKRTTAIKKLQNEFTMLEQKIEQAKQQYNSETEALRKALYHSILERYKVLCDIYLNSKINKKLKAQLLETINIETTLIFEKLQGFEGTQTVENLFQQCNGVSFADHIAEAQQDLDEILEDMSSEFDFSSDMFSDDGEFGQQSRDDEFKNGANFKDFTPRKKPEKKNGEEQKSIKAIYINLMKAFHPDKEMDEQKKLEKTEISKNITAAYSRNDLYSLLSYEFELLGNNQSRLLELAQEKLKMYSTMLLKQKKALESKLYMLKEENEFLYRNMCTKLARPDKFLNRIKLEIESDTTNMTNQISLLQNRKGFVNQFIKEYLDEFYEKNDLYDFPF